MSDENQSSSIDQKITNIRRAAGDQARVEVSHSQNGVKIYITYKPPVVKERDRVNKKGLFRADSRQNRIRWCSQ